MSEVRAPGRGTGKAPAADHDTGSGPPITQTRGSDAGSNPETAARDRSPFYIFKIPSGMTGSAWFPMLARNRLAVSPARIPFALRLSVYSVINSVVAFVQDLVFASRIAATELEPPIFIIGHWRTGTTWIHELLALGQNFITPVTLECFAPGQALVAGWLLRKLVFLLPETRPMDNVRVGWDLPQEDEFALLNLGLGSPYETMIFPNRRPVRPEFLNLTGTTAAQTQAWKSGLTRFLKQVTFRSQSRRDAAGRTRRVVAKSPPHTARLGVLQQLFPRAQFIHVVRDPYEIFASTVRLWRRLYETQAVQKPEFGALPGGGPSVEDYVLQTMDLLYRDFAARVSDIPPGQFCQVRYEDLVAEPVRELGRIYAELKLGSFDTARPAVEAYLQEHQTYRPNVHQLSPRQKVEVETRWRWYFQQYGYPMRPS